MKREILCIKCAEYLKYNVLNAPYPGEHVKLIKGKLKLGGCICDHCGTPLEVKEEVYCLSIWADYGGIPYYKWEHEYIIQGR